MLSDKEKYIEDLGQVIRELADTWPNDRDGVMVAGATFEQTVENLEDSGVQLKKLIDLAWKGLIHLYESDDFFLSVKNATMHSVNTVREYLINEGDISVEDFEHSCELMEKALSGGGESADKVVDLKEIPDTNAQSENIEPEPEQESEPEPSETSYSLNDLATAIIDLDESPSREELEAIIPILDCLINSSNDKVQQQLAEARRLIEDFLAGKEDTNWLSGLSATVEAAMLTDEDEEDWQQTGGSDEINEQPESAPEPEPEPEPEPASESDPEPAPEQEPEDFVIPHDIEVEMIGEFITECTDLIETAEVALLDLEESPDDDELVNTIFRAFHTIKGTSAFMGLDPLSEFMHSAETLLSNVRDGELPFDKACADISLKSIDILKKLLAIVENASGGDSLPTPPEYDIIMRVLHSICEEKVNPADAISKEGGLIEDAAPEGALPDDSIETDSENLSSEESLAQSAAKQNGTQQKTKQDSDSSVRVNVGRLDRLIDMVGELVIAHSVVAQDSTISRDSELMKKLNHTTKIIRELQDASLTLRMVPLKATFNRMNRLVRDLARKAGKQVKFSTIGADTEIDRNMVDIISEPLVHMLRNSIDHGIEKPEDRAASNKSEMANIWLRAYQEGGKVVIEIEDDGKGIDKEKILKKGIEKGLVETDKKLTDSEIFSLIFLPGFSSVEKVTDLSGRGVGMDVVRRSIEQLQGKVEVQSKLGQGTKVSLELPFTLAITDGMLVRIGDQRFIIPTINIDMTFRPEEHHIFTVLGSSEQVNFRGKSIPVIRLHKLFRINGALDNLLDGTLLVIDNNNKKYALLVDEVIGQQQLVGKSININVQMPHISGGAILGDGRVGLILDTSAIGAKN